MIKLRNLFCFILTIVCFWYQVSGTRNPVTGTRFWYQFLVTVSGQYVMGIIVTVSSNPNPTNLAKRSAV